MTQPGIEPWSPGPLANTLLTWSMRKVKVIASKNCQHNERITKRNKECEKQNVMYKVIEQNMYD